MPNQYYRLLPPTVLSGTMKTESDKVFDAGAYDKLAVQVRIPRAGSAGTIKLQSAAVNEDQAYTDISGASWNLDATTNEVDGFDIFMRYVRTVSTSAAGDPLVIIDIIAKGS